MKENFKPDKYPLGMSYVPWQCWDDIMAPEQAFELGSVFRELILPFCWKGGR